MVFHKQGNKEQLYINLRNVWPYKWASHQINYLVDLFVEMLREPIWKILDIILLAVQIASNEYGTCSVFRTFFLLTKCFLSSFEQEDAFPLYIWLQNADDIDDITNYQSNAVRPRWLWSIYYRVEIILLWQVARIYRYLLIVI